MIEGTKTFGDNVKEEIEKAADTGELQFVGWNELLPEISTLVRLREDEQIEGFLLNENGIRVKVSRKKGRRSRR